MREILAEAGLSECARSPEVPGCDMTGLEVFLLVVFALVVVVPGCALRISSAIAVTRSIHRHRLMRRTARFWITVVWAIPVLGPLTWAVRTQWIRT